MEKNPTKISKNKCNERSQNQKDEKVLNNINVKIWKNNLIYFDYNDDGSVKSGCMRGGVQCKGEKS